MPGWGEITSANVVSVVVSETYAIPDQAVADPIFKLLAAKAFERVATGFRSRGDDRRGCDGMPR